MQQSAIHTDLTLDDVKSFLNIGVQPAQSEARFLIPYGTKSKP